MGKMIQLVWVPVLVACGACSSLLRGPLAIDPAATHEIPPFAIPPTGADGSYERFIVIGDMGTGLAGQHAVAAAMARRAAADGLDFIITAGDNFYPGGVTSADDPQWSDKFEEVYADPALKVPVYPTLGNHDHRGSVQAQVDYGRRNENWKMGGLYYTFTRTLADGTKVQFFAIDSEPIQGNQESSGAQLAWLEGELGQSAARWKIVVGHHPLYGHNPWRGHNATMIGKLEPLLTEHSVDVYFAGHDHTLEMIKPVGGVHYVISGAGGGPDWAYPVQWTDESFYVATLGGFVLCRVSRNELVIEFVRMDGETQYAHVLSK